MKIFKFGGASIKDAGAVRNMAGILRTYQNEHPVVVVSAMGKTTNALEKVVFSIEPAETGILLNEVVDFHLDMATGLFDNKRPIGEIKKIINELKNTITKFPAAERSDQFYDAVVSYGELLSSGIITAFLKESGIRAEWIDARNMIITDDNYREAEVIWPATCQHIQETFSEINPSRIMVTQGFIGSTVTGHTTTLGREGSDFTAAILASCLNAESVVIWKDVAGILNADPKRFARTRLYKNLSYQEAAEMTYYGASVIHPKTIKPLANKGIPLVVKSFEKPDSEGTVINEGEMHSIPPTFVVKENQCLISFIAKDLNFINEHNLSIIFHVLDMLNIKINMMQNSAVSLTICVDMHDWKINELRDTLKQDFKILYNETLRLITVKNYTAQAIGEVSKDETILVEQRTRNTFQIVVSN